MASDRLFQLASELLSAASSLLSVPISRQVVSPADVVFDCCPMLAVSPTQLTKTPLTVVDPLSEFESVTAVRPNGWTLLVTVLRCSVYSGDDGQAPPAAAAITSVSAQTYTDLWELWTGLQDAVRGGQLFTSLGCKAVGIGPAVPVDEGGCAGWVIGVQLIPDGEGS